MKYENKLKDIINAEIFWETYRKIQLSKKETIRYTYAPSMGSKNTSYNDYDTIRTTGGKVTIFESAKCINEIDKRIECAEAMIHSLKEEKELIESYISQIQQVDNNSFTLKEKISKLIGILPLTEISEVLNCSYDYVKEISSKTKPTKLLTEKMNKAI